MQGRAGRQIRHREGRTICRGVHQRVHHCLDALRHSHAYQYVHDARRHHLCCLLLVRVCADHDHDQQCIRRTPPDAHGHRQRRVARRLFDYRRDSRRLGPLRALNSPKVGLSAPCRSRKGRRIMAWSQNERTSARHKVGAEELSMSEKIYDVPAQWQSRAFVNDAKYKQMYAASLEDPGKFWAEQAKRITWSKPFTKVKNTSFAPGNISIKWFEDGKLNACFNCVDRHLEKRGDQTAIIWEGDDPKNDAKVTYKQLHAEVSRFANVLKKQGVKKGDRVTIYMPMIVETAYAMLACTRIGAIHSVVFGGFSPDSLAGRLVDCESKFVITADEGLRGGKTVPLKDNTDKAIDIAARNFVMVEKVLVVRRTGGKVGWANGRDVWYH